MPGSAPYSGVVLAGERPGGSDFSRELGLPASVLAEVDGQAALARVIRALRDSDCVDGGLLCGPTEVVYRGHRVFDRILEGSGFRWLAPQEGPSASALAAVDKLGRYPVLLTAGDHALLTPALVDDFCRRAQATGADVAFGLVPYRIVHAAYPESRRTVLKLGNGGYCGSNLFALLNKEGRAGPAFWSRLEADRKKPWRMARRIGLGPLLSYLLGRLTLDSALEALSGAMGCRVGCVIIEEPRAAIDVDSVADRDLAEKILREEAAG